MTEITDKQFMNDIKRIEKEMKMKIVIEKKGEYIEIPISHGIINSLNSIFYQICPECFKCMKLNTDLKSFQKFHTITDHIIYDIIYEGKTMSLKGKKLVENKERHYLIKKPKWKKKSKKRK